MSTGALFSGLIDGYGKQILSQDDQKRKDERDQKANQLEILRAAASSPDITDEAREAIWGQMWDMASGKKPGAKGKNDPDPMHTMFGHLTGMTKPPGGPQTPAGPTVAPGATTPQVQTLPQPAVAQPQPVNLGTPPAPPTVAAGATPSPAASPSQAGTLGAPPAPPHLFKTRAEKQAEAIQRAKDATDQSVAARQQQEEGYNQAYRDANDGKEPPDDVKKSNHDFAFFGIHPASKRTVDTSSTFPDGKGGFYHNVLDEAKNVVGQVPAMAKPNRFQQEVQNKVQNWKAVNKPKDGESPEDYAQRGELFVRKQQYDTDAGKLIGLGLGNAAKVQQIERIKETIKNGDMGYRNANILWKGAFAAARARKQTDLDAMDKPINSLVDEELSKLGTSMAEVSGVIRSGMEGGGGGTGKPVGKVTTADALAKKLHLAP
jgi:hypothetical protein